MNPILKSFSRALTYVFASLSVFTACEKEVPKQRANVIIFIADDVSVNDIGVYGNRAVSTPIIDSLAANGMLFANAFLTTSSCSPSRASIISGRYPHNTGAPELHMPLSGTIETLAGQLKEGGYFTGASGKWHLGEGVRQDFDLVLDSDIGLGGESRWSELLAEIPSEKPYFLWLASVDAHRGWGENEFDGVSKMDAANLPPYVVADSATLEDFRQYYDEIARFDHHIGETLKKLADKNRLDNTLVFILADNGRPFPRDKTRLYDSGLQTPFIAYWHNGSMPQGSRSDALVSTIDLAPTISKICGFNPLEAYQGMDFSNVLKNPGAEHRNYVFGEHNWHDYRAFERMVRSKTYLYIENHLPESQMSSAADVHSGASFLQLVNGHAIETLDSIQLQNFIQPRPTVELYNTKEDKLQLKNLILLDEYAQEKLQLHNKLLQWKELTGDTKPSKLTENYYDFYTAKSLFPDNPYNDIDRGEIPGASKNAVQIISKDESLQNQ